MHIEPDRTHTLINLSNKMRARLEQDPDLKIPSLRNIQPVDVDAGQRGKEVGFHHGGCLRNRVPYQREDFPVDAQKADITGQHEHGQDRIHGLGLV